MSDDQKQQPEPVDAITDPAVIKAKITELAALSDVEYGQCRHAAENELGCGLEFLDKAVRKRQARDGNGSDGETSGKGSQVLFPDIEPCSEPVDGAELLDDLVQAINRHAVTPKGAPETVALWALFAHTHNDHVISPMLAILAPEPECGKSTLLDVVSWLVPKPLPSGGTSAAVIYRVVEEYHPTLLTDELDTLPKETGEAIRGIYNAGHTRRFANILRTVAVGDDHEVRRFSTWAPKAIAQIGKPPVTMLLRSIIVHMTRKPASQEVVRLPPDGTEELHDLARKCTRWAIDNSASLRGRVPPLPAGMGNRLADNWTPLLNIADLAGDRWARRARDIAAQSSGHIDDASVGILALQDIAAIFAKHRATKLGSDLICEELHRLEDRPWAEFGRKQSPITKTQLARTVLSRYDLKPTDIRPDPGGISGKNCKGYDIEDFKQAFVAYLPPPSVTPRQPTETGALSVFPSATEPEPVTDEKPPKPASSLSCHTVTLPDGGRQGDTGGETWESDL